MSEGAAPPEAMLGVVTGGDEPPPVMPGLDPGIHDLAAGVMRVG